jgi:Fe-S-cluster-containing hydrogenase component 2
MLCHVFCCVSVLLLQDAQGTSSLTGASSHAQKQQQQHEWQLDVKAAKQAIVKVCLGSGV